MPIVNGREIRELWMVQFASTKNEGGKTINLVPIIAGIKCWAVSGDVAVDIAKQMAEKEHLPWLGLRGITSLDIIESHIWNQPKTGENTEPVQPHRGSVPRLADLRPLEEESVAEGGLPQLQLAQSPHESQDLRSTEEELSTPASLIVKP
jgi:hypothetical protein